MIFDYWYYIVIGILLFIIIFLWSEYCNKCQEIEDLKRFYVRDMDRTYKKAEFIRVNK